MITHKRIKIENFGSIEDIEYAFDGSPKSIQGINKTDKGQESNGSGKSRFQGAIQFALLGSNSWKEVSKDLIRRGTKSARIEDEWYCDIRDESLIIVREQHKSGSKLTLYKNEVSEKALYPFGNIDDGNDRIMKWFDTNKEDLVSNYIIDQERFKSFFSTTNKDRLDFVARVSDTKFMDSIDINIKTDIGKAETNIETKNRGVSRLNGGIEIIDSDILDLTSVKDTNSKADLIKTIESAIKSANDSIIDYNRLLTEVGDELVQLEDKRDLVKITHSKALLELPDASKLENELFEANKAILETKSDIMEIDKTLQGKIECPSCKTEFILGNTDFKIAEELSFKKDLEDIVKDLEEEKTGIEKDLADINKNKRQAREIEASLSKIDSDISKKTREEKRILSDIEDEENSIKRNNERIIKINSEPVSDRAVEIKAKKDKKEQLQLDKIRVTKEITDLETELASLKEWKLNFVRFRMDIANDIIKGLQDTCNYHLDKMGTDLRVQIEGFKINSKGALKEEITPLLVRDNAYKFSSYSKGEKARAEIAMILAKQDIINGLNKWGGIKFLAVDEIFEGLDGLGLKYLMKSISNVGQDVLITTHVRDDRIDSDTIIIEKVFGISRIKLVS